MKKINNSKNNNIEINNDNNKNNNYNMSITIKPADKTPKLCAPVCVCACVCVCVWVGGCLWVCQFCHQCFKPQGIHNHEKKCCKKIF